MNYTHYKVEDFVLDESFRNWILSKNPRDEVFWRKWIEIHPGMKPVLEDARSIILVLQDKENKVSQAEIDRQFESVSSFYDQKFAPESKNISWNFIARIAASLLILVAAGIGIFYQSPDNASKQIAERTIETLPEFHLHTNETSNAENPKQNITASSEKQEQTSEKIASKQPEKEEDKTEKASSELAETITAEKAPEPSSNYITTKGEQQKITLPDGSRVYLNEQSQLAFANNWQGDAKRIVQLKGEAFFQVEEKMYEGKKVKFVVATKDVRVEVVGTEFTVKEFVKKTQVFLQTGKIMLNLPDKKQTLEMNPKDMVEYHPESGRVQQMSNADHTPFLSWVNNFDRVVHEAAQYMTSQMVNEPEKSGQNNNLSKILQQGEENNAYIEQIGNNLKSGQVQKGEGNQAETRISGVRDDKDEVGWSTGQIQEGEDNVSIFDIVDSYNSNMFSGQEGKENVVTGRSHGEDNMGFTLQFGTANQAEMEQEGRQNNIIILQKGTNNQVIDPSSLKGGVYQQGRFNDVIIIQRGVNNKARTIQQGRNNQSNINQNGN